MGQEYQGQPKKATEQIAYFHWRGPQHKKIETEGKEGRNKKGDD